MGTSFYDTAGIYSTGTSTDVDNNYSRKNIIAVEDLDEYNKKKPKYKDDPQNFKRKNKRHLPNWQK